MKINHRSYIRQQNTEHMLAGVTQDEERGEHISDRKVTQII